MSVRVEKNRAFTLVELMIVVAILGVLAALATYGLSRYLKHSKTAEAMRNLAALEAGSKMQYQIETAAGGGGGGAQSFAHEYCPSTAMVPSTVPAAAKYNSNTADWSAPGWTCLKFAILDPQAYAYQYTTNGLKGIDAAYTANAYGDLDGNGTMSIFEINGRGGSNGDSVRLSWRVFNEDE